MLIKCIKAPVVTVGSQLPALPLSYLTNIYGRTEIQQLGIKFNLSFMLGLSDPTKVYVLGAGLYFVLIRIKPLLQFSATVFGSTISIFSISSGLMANNFSFNVISLLTIIPLTS